MNPLKAGDIAPKFSLPDQDGEQVNLTDFQGQRVLVYFYPKAMTPGCTVQACGLRDNMDELKKAGVDVLGISTDKPEKLSRFAEKELLNLRSCLMRTTRCANNSASGVKSPSWAKPTMVFIASAS